MHGHPVPVKNTTGEVIPAGGWMEPTGTLASNSAAVQVRKATRGGLAGFVNSFAAVPANGSGQGYSAYPLVTLAVHPSDTLGAGDTLGPLAGDWYCRKGQPGFRVLGPAFGGFVPALAEGGGGSGTVWLLPTAVNTGGLTEWTAATLYGPDAADGQLGAAGTTVQVHFPGGFLRAGVPAPAVRVGQDPGTGTPRYRVAAVVYRSSVPLPACDPTTGALSTTTLVVPTLSYP